MHWARRRILIVIIANDTTDIRFSSLDAKMSNHHDDEALFPLEMGEHRSPLGDAHDLSIDPNATTIVDNDDDNRFIDNDTGVDPSQNKWEWIVRLTWTKSSVDFASQVETVQITETIVNPHGERVAPDDFQLLKVLGKGGYGKVSETNALARAYPIDDVASGVSSEKSLGQSSRTSLCYESAKESHVWRGLASNWSARSSLI
jgi:hypothetical protein